MSKDIYNIERTSAGQQFVIPGTEKPEPIIRESYKVEGTQFIIPGTEKITNKSYLDRLMSKPILPRKLQKSLKGTLLFGT